MSPIQHRPLTAAVLIVALAPHAGGAQEVSNPWLSERRVLNFAHGAIRWDAMVDTDCNKRTDTKFSDLVQGAEALRTSTDPSRSELIAYKSKLECVNGGK